MGLTTNDTLLVRTDVVAVARSCKHSKKVVGIPNKLRKEVDAVSPGPQDSPVLSAADTSLTMTRPKNSVLTKQEKNRAKVRRCYYRRITNIQTLRSEVSILETRYLDLLQVLADEERQQQSEQEVKETHIQHPVTVRERMLHLSKLKVALYEENEMLRNCVREHMKDQGRMQQIIDEELDGTVEINMKARGVAADIDDCGIVVLRLLTPIESMELGRSSFQEIDRFMQRQVYFPNENDVLGWVLRRHTEDGLHMYLLRKTFHYRSPFEMTEALWKTLLNPSKYARLFSKALNMRLQIVQRIDENNLMYYRIIARDGANTEFRTLFLLTRFQTANGFMIVCQGLKRDRVQELSMPKDRRVEWWDMFSWFSIERTGNFGEHCMFTFGGSRPESFGVGIEALLVVLQWECRVLHPPSVLP